MLYNMPWLIRDKKTGVYVAGSLDPPNPFDVDPHAEQRYEVNGYLDGGIYAYPAVLLQYTGAKDDSKEAREIYDGDIVQTMTMWSEKNIARVLWGDVHPMNRWYSGPTWLLHFENGLEGPLYPYCDRRNGYTVKIIGNVYEHPELFSEKPV